SFLSQIPPPPCSANTELPSPSILRKGDPGERNNYSHSGSGSSASHLLHAHHTHHLLSGASLRAANRAHRYRRYSDRGRSVCPEPYCNCSLLRADCHVGQATEASVSQA